MYAQICRDYNCLPAIDEITSGQIRWFYSMLIDDLIKQTTPES